MTHAIASALPGCRIELLEPRRLLSGSMPEELCILAAEDEPAAVEDWITEDPEELDILLAEDEPATGDDWVTEDLAIIEVHDGSRVLAPRDGMLSGVLTRFTGTLPADQYTANIWWGDGTESVATVVPQADGTYAVVADHQFDDQAEYNVWIEIVGSDGSWGCDCHRVFTYADDLVVTMQPSLWVYQSEGDMQTYLGSFFDRTPGDESSYAVTIDWGDGTSSPGTIARNWEGGFDVIGQHAYLAIGSFEVRFTVSEAGTGSSLVAAGVAEVWQDEPASRFYHCAGLGGEGHDWIIGDESRPFVLYTGTAAPLSAEGQARSDTPQDAPLPSPPAFSDKLRIHRNVDQADDVLTEVLS